MNDNLVKGKWQEIKGEIQKAWGNLTGDEIEKTQGNMTSLTGVIQQRYGHKEDDIKTKLSGIFERFTDSANEKIDQVKESVRDQNDSATERNNYKQNYKN